MKLVADTPMMAGWLPWSFEPGTVRMVLAVKATFDLVASGVCPLARAQAFLRGDEPWDDDVDRSLRYASDMELLKPQGEAWVTGTLRTGEPARELACSARVGAVEVRFSVVGDRWWRGDGGTTAPVPFTEMELCWERSFGGPGTPNPVGRGIAVDPNDAEGRVPLPNIEHADRLVRSPSERPRPVGAWPIPRTWPERMRLTGTYDADYTRTRWPYFAADLSWRYCQAAPEAQRIEGYWRGDEEIELHNLHPEHPFVRCRLPGIRPRAFLHERTRPEGPLREVGLLLDTIAIDVGEGKAYAVWRGTSPCASESFDEFAHVYLAAEPIDAPRTEREYLGAFVARLRALWEEEQAFEAAPIPESGPVSEASPDTAGPGDAEPRADVTPPSVPTPYELVAAQRREALERGWPTELVEQLYPAEPSVAAPPEAPERVRARIEAAIGACEQLGLGAAVEGLRAIVERLSSTAEADEEARPSKREPPPGLWTAQELRDEVQRRLAAGESLARLVLAEADLSLLDLSGQDLSGAILVRSDLRHTNLDGAKLDGAVLDSALLDGATFRGASLSAASLASIEADGVDFAGAVLEDAVLERATLVGATLRGVRGRGLVLESCRADGADFEQAMLEDAELTRCSLARCTFRGAVLTGARLDGSDLHEACLDTVDAARVCISTGADLTDATLRWAVLANASFAGATCVRARFAESDLTRASFAGTDLEAAELLAVRARGASFARARLTGANLSGADLLGARFESAQLSRADLTNANLYQAELWRAELTAARLDGANVEGTKLA
jgi:uncharacterized protein YjbI with pentapeptide repeats